MERIKFISNHTLFRFSCERLAELEKNRRFCCHQMNHLLDVARIAYIRNLERNLGFKKEIIYATALLHDVGKYAQYENGTPHEIKSAEIAEIILSDMPENICFTSAEQEEIITAIRGHRKLRENASALESLLYESDKASRTCFSCPAETDCNWSMSKKNMEIII